TTDAIEYVNMVRRRAYGKSLGEGIRYIEVQNAGTGYTEEPVVNIVGGGGYGAEARAILSGSTVKNVVVTNPGVGYTSTPTVIFAGVGTGATATATPTDRMTTDAELKTVDTEDKQAFREAIRKERALELGYEGLRRFDLVRW